MRHGVGRRSRWGAWGLLLGLVFVAGCPEGTRQDPVLVLSDAGVGCVGEGCAPSCGALVWDAERRRCVGCLADGDCAFGVCHPSKSVCVRCVDDGDCEGGAFCQPERNYCVQCFADAHCPSGHCDLGEAVCVGCGRDADCNDNNPCTVGVCADKSCEYSPVADGAACEADPCRLDDRCVSGMCVAGDTVASACLGCEHNADCGPGDWCERASGACEGPGRCVARPEGCSPVKATVCGCDGQVYDSPCEAARAGAGVGEQSVCCPPLTCEGIAEDVDGDGCADRCVCETEADCCGGAETGCGLTCRRAQACGEAPGEGQCVPLSSCEGPDGGAAPSPVCACKTLTFESACAAWNAGFETAEPGCCGDAAVLAVCPEGFLVSDGAGCLACACSPDGAACSHAGVTFGSECELLLVGEVLDHLGACGCAPLSCDWGGVPVDSDKDGCADRCACGAGVACEAGAVCAPVAGDGACQGKLAVCAPCVTETGPMCGCDGKTYPSACAAHQAGVAIEAAGECECVNSAGCGAGQYCDADMACGGAGQCRDCALLPVPLCGCDGQSYLSACDLAKAGSAPAAFFGCGCAALACEAGTQAVDVDGDSCPETCMPVCGGPCDCLGPEMPALAVGDHFECVLGACQAVGGGLSAEAAACVGPKACETVSDCGPAGYCQKVAGVCGGGGGTCVARPAACPVSVEPVCGCDGVTRSGSCEAAQKGVNVSHISACCAFQGCPDGQVASDPDGDGCPDTCVACPVPACEPFEVAADLDGSGCNESCVAKACQTNDDCKGGYCAKTIGVCETDVGTCAGLPGACLIVSDPVCGCDQKTWENACLAAQTGVNAAFIGPCTAVSPP